MRRAAKVDANQSVIVKTLRAAGMRVLVLSAVGHGCPDLLVYRPATKVLRLLEVKDGSRPPSERKLTPMEEAFAQLFPVAIVNSEWEALDAMGAI